MVSQNTNDVPPKRTRIIIFSNIVGVFAILSTYTFLSFNKESKISLVKDNIVVAQNVSEEKNTSKEELTTIGDDKPIITTYVVKSGDSISSIAAKFSISSNTLLWANDLTKKSLIKQGQKLTILPVSGIVHTVVKGDTLGGIAEKFDADIEEIISFNDLENTKSVKIGMELIIPNGELPVEKEIVFKEKIIVKKVSVEIKKEPSESVETKKVSTEKNNIEKTELDEKPVSKTSFTHPIPGAILTQGVHGYNGVDFGAPIGTSVLAFSDGVVIVAKSSGYNGGYGKHIVIEHENGTQTLYAHLSEVFVSVDDSVNKSDKIGLSGNTGKSTGPHLHFEVRGGTNPWVGVKKLTRF
jgi:murein DD-endopeptidase MepM/ murein hydrolase activator NlpD